MKKVRTTAKRKAQLKALKRKKEREIISDEIPEILDWKDGERGKFYRPVKQAISLRVDADVLAWIKSGNEKYQTKINEILRDYMQRHRRSA
jgi:uncharacterized protein (DUF4415 family)